MRCDQDMGMPFVAVNFLKENSITSKICETCNRPIPLELEKIGHYEGMFGNKYPLVKFQLKDGGYANQYLQAHPWWNGPVAFIGLKVYDKKDHLHSIFAWSQEDIDNV